MPLGLREPIRIKRSDKNITNYFRKYCLFFNRDPAQHSLHKTMGWQLCVINVPVLLFNMLHINNSNVWAQAMSKANSHVELCSLPCYLKALGNNLSQSLHKLMLHAYLQVCGSWQQPCSSERKSGSRHCMYRFPWGEPQQVNTKNISKMRNHDSEKPASIN